MKQRKMKFSIRQMLPIIIIVIAGAIFIVLKQPEVTQVRIAEKVLTNLLNAPDEELKTAFDNLFLSAEIPENANGYGKNDATGIVDLDSKEIRDVVSELLENNATDSFTENCVRINEVMSLQHYAILYGFQIELKDLSVKRTPQKDTLEYDASVQILMNEKENQLVHVSGLVQFNNDMKISAITLRSKELSAFYTSLTQR